MRITAFFLLALISINAVQAVSLRKNADSTSYAIQKLRFVGKKSAAAQQIISAVELHLSSGGKVDDVILLVESALQDVENRRNDLQTEFFTKKTDLENVIQNAEQSLQNSNDRLVVVNSEINNLQAEINHLTLHIENVQVELQNLAEHEVHVRNARQIDITTFEARRIRDEESVNILGQVVQRLQGLQQRGNAFLQVSDKEIERALSRIPKSNPLKALIQLSTKFDAEKLAVVIQKLEQIRQAVQNSQNDDRNKENQSLEHFNNLINQINQLRADKEEDLAQSNVNLNIAQASLRQYENEKTELLALIESTQQLIDETKQNLAETIRSFEARLSEADQAINVIKSVIEILVSHQSQLQNRENASDTLNGNVSGSTANE